MTKEEFKKQIEHPIDKIGIEHFVFMKLLEECPSARFQEIVDLYCYIIKD